jgi:hypothetical protein
VVLPLTCKFNISVKNELYQCLEEKAKFLHKDEDTLIIEALEWYLQQAETNPGTQTPVKVASLKRHS